MSKAHSASRPVLFLALCSTFVISACKDGGTEPPTPVPTSISLNKTTVSLDAIGATDQLTATVKDQNGATMSGQSVTWTSSAEGVATVSNSGLVTAVANGTATITAKSGTPTNTATVTVAQVATAASKTAGDAQTATVGQALPTDLTVQVEDRLGNGIAGLSVSFSVSADGGSVSPTSGTTDGTGQLSTTWTLGTVAGVHTVTATTGSASTVFDATATADVASDISAFLGDGQTGLVSADLPDPIVVQVVDQYGNPVAGEAVTFAVTGGGGSVSPTDTTTDASGLAQSVWTLGATQGAQSAEASASGLNGSPVAFSATGTSLSISSILPDTIVEGASATIDGAGFDPTPGNNTVTIGGTAATVTAASGTQLTVTVPTFDCMPQRAVNVQVGVGGSNSNTVSHPLKPADVVNLAVGEMMLIDDPAKFCLQFEPATAGSGDYLVGMGAAADSAGILLPVSMSAVTGQAAPAPAFAPVTAAPLAQSRTFRTPDPELLQQWEARFEAEQRLRQWERDHLDPSTNPTLRQALATPRSGPVGAPQAVPNVGDTLHFHVPDVDGSPCDSIPITTIVKAVGSAGIFVVDTNNPATDSLTDVEIQAYSDTFDNQIYATDTLYFGTPSDLDANQRVFVVLTIEVNKFAGGAYAGFVFSGDLYDASVCATSDYGEIFYGNVPDPTNEAGTNARSKTSVLGQMPSLIAHEFTHNIQQSRRILELGGTPLSSWEAEGQATLAEEVVGHAVLGNSPGQDYGPTTVYTGGGTRWYDFIFDRLSWYYGYDGAGGHNANTPEDCTLYGSSSLTTSCRAFWFYGSSWSFQRFLADQLGTGWPGGEAGFTKDWIDNNPSLSGVANVEALLGMPIDTVFAQWAAMHYVDGQVVGADPTLLMSSWNIHDIMAALNANAALQPVARSFTDFSASESVRGGSTAYSLFSGAGARPAVAIRVRDGSDVVLGAGMRPQLWIVRTQ